MKKLLLPLVFIFICSLAQAQDYLLPCRPGVLPQLAPFYHGVASGDPLSDRVIIWTRITLPFDTRVAWVNIDSQSAVYSSTIFDTTVLVAWQMATDTLFTNIVNSGTVSTDSSLDYTVKMDVTGLQPNTWYYYRFSNNGIYSIIGRTRTTPVGNVDSLRFAIFSCSDFQTGFFNAYHDIAHRNDIDAVIHLGDYYYEYAAGGSDYQGDTIRLHAADHDAYTLADYRLWHSQYKLDPDQRDIFQQYPWIQIWDDHDVANNSWYSGAQNHNPATEGNWFIRKSAAFQAYFEWLPIREQAPDNDTIIHRNFTWGNLLNFIMLDTRYEDRDSSLGTGISLTNAYLTDTNRNMIGPHQLAWFKTQLSDTTTQWKIIGNQVMIAPLDAVGTALNGDQWDGYPAERKRVFDYIMQQNIHDVVFVTGDIHSSWANDLPHPDSTYNSSTGAGSVATEFIGTSITSTATAITLPQAIIQLGNPHIKYCEFTMRGYLLFDINKQRVQGDFIHMSTTASRTYTASDDQQWVNINGNRFLGQAAGVLPPRNTNPPFAPWGSDMYAGINRVNQDKMVIVTCFPNPSQNEVAIQFYLYQPTKVDLNVYDINGKLVVHQTDQQTQVGLYSTKVYLDGLIAGTYMLTISDGTNTYARKIVKD
jgi:alkaline phosphatase D